MYGDFVLIERSGKVERAQRVFLGDVKDKDEAWLRDTLFNNPEIIPIDVTEPVHDILLNAGVCFLQVTTRLDRIGPSGWQVCAFPLKIVGGTGAPLRAFAAR